MSRRRKEPPPDDYFELVKEYGIEFEGRITPDQWREYSSQFEKIRHIGRITHREFFENNDSDDAYFRDKKIKAAELTREAWNCLSSMDSEQGWRKEVEDRVLARFDSEIVCHVCQKRRWEPRFEARSTQPQHSERGHEARERRLLCSCDELTRAESSSRGDRRMFTREMDKFIEHKDVSGTTQSKLIQKKFRPDRVIGLGMTPTFRRLLTLRRRESYCPFKSSVIEANVIYPFIVVEAKTAESANTFGSVFRQTAFVARTCLRLQQNLVTESRIDHQCLVWTFAVIGEEWRLYASIPNDLGVKTFDLWHGSVLHPEGALQLLLIIDYICTWAMETYRMSLLKCLEGSGRDYSDYRLTPSSVGRLSQSLDPDPVASQPFSPQSRELLELNRLSDDDPMEIDDGKSSKVEEGSDLNDHPQEINPTPQQQITSIHSWDKWTRIKPGSAPWTRRATIRHSSHIQFHFLVILLPEDPSLLRTLLESSFSNNSDFSIVAIAQKFLTSLDSTKSALTTTCMYPSGTFEVVRVLSHSKSNVDQETWQIRRHVLSIICNQRSLDALSVIAGTNTTLRLDLNRKNVLHHSPFKRAFNSLRFMGGARSAALALSMKQLCLRAIETAPGMFRFAWIELSPVEGGLTGTDFGTIMLETSMKKRLSLKQLQHPSKTFIETSELLDVEAKRENSVHLDPSVNMPTFQSDGLIIKGPGNSAAEREQEFCYMVIDESLGFENEEKLGKLMMQSLKNRDKFTAGGRLIRQDNDFIERWAKELMGQSESETGLEDMEDM